VNRTNVGGLSVADELYRFVMDEALPGSGVEADTFWAGAEALIREFAPQNRMLLARRDELQAQIDDLHRGRQPDVDYDEFLRSIGYRAAEPDPFEISTSGVDDEIRLAGPQLVVPLLNARFAINAANARWGSLYDALYGSDVIGEDAGRHRGAAYNPTRGAAVVRWCRNFLDATFPLGGARHVDVTAYRIGAGDALVAVAGGTEHRLAEPAAFVGYRGDPGLPEAVLLRHHGLHLEIRVDRVHPVGAVDPAGVADIVAESAVTTIMDLEDSVAAVDAADKVVGYRNWLRLMQGRLTEEVTKGGRTFTRVLEPDRSYTAAGGGSLSLPGRALLFIREVGPALRTDAVLVDGAGPVPEELLDALVCGLGSLHDLRGEGALRNSRSGAMYVVKPKLHGPDEVAYTCAFLSRVEEVLQVAPLTIKVGIMDEERRTSANLRACVHAARERIAFLNTGFLDRTGDEIHTSMHAGPVVRKAAMRDQPWIRAYEDGNVDVALAAGFAGRAQIGKGMWAAPDNLAEMLEQKIAHPQAGASCAWVPSPTAATLHALHYHRVDVARRQRQLTGRVADRARDLLTIPVLDPATLSPADIQAELENNVQGVLGYVVRWVNAGVGCSKVPDIHGVPLMEDRATCRISSQHIANWMLHGVVNPAQVEEALRRMAAIVDDQNAGDPDYRRMGPDFAGPAFDAARSLIFDGAAQPNGYTEAILHSHRRAVKESVPA
jgi:malate synthase